MGTGYTRNDTGNNIADGNVINASDLDGEFDAIQSAFNSSTGHSHDGTTGEGPQIGTGGIADLAVTTGKIASNAVTLGTKTSGNYVATIATSAGLDGSASSEGATPTISLNLNELTTSTADGDGDYFVVVDTGGTQRKLTKANISVSGFNTANGIALGTDTTGNYVATGAVSGIGLSGSASSEGSTFTITSNATNVNTGSTIVSRDASGNFSAGTITAALTGNAATATALQTARTIAGISFNGTANIAIASTNLSDASSINAATLDSLDSTQFLRSDAADTKTSGDLSFSDNVKAIFGAGSDLQIYHDGSNSYITETGTGDLEIRANEFLVKNASGTGTGIHFDPNTSGEVKLYHNNQEKLKTTSTGVDVTGSIEVGDGHTIGDDVNDNLTLTSSTGENIKLDSAGGTTLFFESGSEVARISSGNVGIGTTSVLSNSKLNVVQGIVARNDGAVNPYFQTYNGDAGTDLKTWRFGGQDDGKFLFQTVNDAYSSATTRMSIDSSGIDITGNANFADNGKAIFGAGDDLQIYHQGSHSFVEDTGTGNLYLATNGTSVRITKGPQNAENMAAFNVDGSAVLYYDNAAKISTTATGIDVTGNINAVDNIYLASTIYHEGDTNNYMQFHATDQWRVVTGGTEMLEINDNYILAGSNTVGKTETAIKTGSVTPNLYVYNSFVWTLTGNITLNNPSTEVMGMSGVFIFIHSGAARTVSLGTDWETAGAAGLTLSSTNGAVDIVPYFVQAGGNILLGTPQLGFG